MANFQKTHAQLKERRALDDKRKYTIEYIIRNLMQSDIKRLNDMKSQIIQKHVKLTGSDGFYHRGQFFTTVTSVGTTSSALQKDAAHPEVREELFEYEKQVKELQNDKVILSQGLSILIRNAVSPQEIRDALPDILLSVMGSPENVLARTKPEMHTISSKLHQLQYEKTLDKIYFYLGSRLLG